MPKLYIFIGYCVTYTTDWTFEDVSHIRDFGGLAKLSLPTHTSFPPPPPQLSLSLFPAGDCAFSLSTPLPAVSQPRIHHLISPPYFSSPLPSLHQSSASHGPAPPALFAYHSTRFEHRLRHITFTYSLPIALSDVYILPIVHWD